jgi:hypothetical protein
MNGKSFDSPVFVKAGKSVLQITGILEALELLDRWPRSRRDGFYEIARWACLSGINGRMTVSSARQGFAGWAKTAGILDDAAARSQISEPEEREPIAA